MSLTFVFNVLPFGLANAGHIFTKVLKEALKYWRNQGLKIIMYLDDGLGGANDFFFRNATMVLSGKAVNPNFKVFGLSRPRPEATIYRTRKEHTNHYTKDPADCCFSELVL
jgi:hypothetical protein